METQDLSIRLARLTDLPRLLEIYDIARAFMRRTGNLHQWENGEGPNEEQLRRDIRGNCLYVFENETGIHASFMFSMAGEPTYAVIQGGSWMSDAPYGVIHRIASDGTVHGILKMAVHFAEKTTNHIRIDTHRDNVVMRHAILKCGFEERGVINLPDGSPRLAYERISGVVVPVEV